MPSPPPPDIPANRFQPGNRANPAGRTKGSRNKVANAFFNDLHNVWEEQGESVLRRAAFEKPMEFAAMVAKLMPAKLEISTPTHGLTDERFQELMDLAERQLALSASMTIEGQALLVDEGGGGPQGDAVPGEVIDLIPYSPTSREAYSPTDREPLLSNTEPYPATDASIFSAALQATPSGQPAEEPIDPASLF